MFQTSHFIARPCGGFLKWGCPQIIHLMGIFDHKPSFLWDMPMTMDSPISCDDIPGRRHGLRLPALRLIFWDIFCTSTLHQVFALRGPGERPEAGELPWLRAGKWIDVVNSWLLMEQKPVNPQGDSILQLFPFGILICLTRIAHYSCSLKIAINRGYERFSDTSWHIQFSLSSNILTLLLQPPQVVRPGSFPCHAVRSSSRSPSWHPLYFVDVDAVTKRGP